ncbi:MAG: amino acid adenylation domain-containing protein [Pseudomonadota bacterium]
MLGHYARPLRTQAADAHTPPLELLAALAAMELSARLGRRLPVSVSHASPALDAGDFAAAAAPQPERLLAWPQWDDQRVRHQAARASTWLLDAADTVAAAGGTPSIAVELTEQQVEMGVEQAGAPVRILCRIGNGTLLVTALCDTNDPWAPACGALAETYAEILHALLADPGRAPAQADGISDASRAWVLGALSGRAYSHGEFIAVPRMVEASTDRHPERTAFHFADRSLSYGEFDGLANALAAALAERGVARGAVVPVLLSNSLEMPVAYQALMKLAAAFVPLDPGWPAQRLHAALSVLDAPVVLCADVGTVPPEFRAWALPLDIAALQPSARRPGVEVRPDDAIYGIFTSGTTGLPKCAINNHRGLSNRLRFMTRYFHGGRDTGCVLQNSKHIFDSSVWQLFWPLSYGGEVVIPQTGAFLDLEATLRTIERHRVSMTDFVPSVFNQVVELAERDAAMRQRLSTLRELVVGGEEITPRMVHKLRALLPQLRVTNAYGPTETSIGMVFHPVETADGNEIPLGRPIDNCHVVVVDEAMRPLPQGACGEMLIGGICVGDGYLRDAERTARVFIDNPFPAIPGPKLYRSGDLGWFDRQGRLRFVGRKDFQVKVGGVRIELGEIESAAQQLAAVHQAKALLAGGENKALTLFVTGDDGLDAQELTRQLRELLPRHNMPRHVLVLPKMPVNDSGKVDRAGLERLLQDHLAQQRPSSAGAQRPPADVLVAQVLGVFREALERRDLQAEDSFFDAGGNSLQALGVVLQLERACGVRLNVQDLFECPTAERAAERVRSVRQGVRADAAANDDDLALMERDAGLYAKLAMATPHAAVRAAPKRILLTGASGFVGGYLARELLRQGGDVQVFALARGRGDVQSQLIESLAERQLWEDGFAGRLHAVKGDLAEARLGVGMEAWSRLASECDAIVHCGALVNFVYDYRMHRASNVLGTLELLELAAQERAKPLHFVSTLGTLDREAALRSEPLAEDFELTQGVWPMSGYSRSKWVAERLVRSAREAGLSATVYRLGEVMPSPLHGLPNQRALTHFLLSACVRLGAVPAAEIRTDWSPADYVARRVVAGVFDPAAWNRDYHAIHPQSVPITDALARAGMPLPVLPCRDWLARLDELVAATQPIARELTLVRGFLPDRSLPESALAAAFAGLLTDNARLFRRDGIAAIEQAQGWQDRELDAAMSAYVRVLRARHDGGATVSTLKETA